MKCPQCAKQVDDNSRFCPFCGFKFPNQPVDNQPQANSQVYDDPAHQVINTSTSMSGGAAVDLSYRNAPEFKRKLITINIIGAIGTIFSGLACFGSAMLRFGENLTSTNYVVYLLMLIIGLLAGLLAIFVGVIPAGKKLFSNGKARGFLENLPGIWIALSVCSCIVALVFQGYILIIG